MLIILLLRIVYLVIDMRTDTLQLKKLCIKAIYRIAQIFGRGQPWRIWQITGGLPNFNNVL